MIHLPPGTQKSPAASAAGDPNLSSTFHGSGSAGFTVTHSQGFAPYSMRRFRPGQAIWTSSYSLYHHLDKVNQNSSEMPKLRPTPSMFCHVS